MTIEASALRRVETTAPQSEARVTPLLTVVVPTFNERENVSELVKLLDHVLAGIAWEVVFVDDDSPDATHALIKSIARKDPRVRCLRRVGRRGLAGASIEGMLSSSAAYVAVMDGDLQHDEAILPAMLEQLRTDACDIAIGSRHVAGGSADDGFTALRAKISAASGAMARLALRADVKDVMSGFFMVRRDLVEEIAPRLCSEGFKILADLLASAPGPVRVAELPYTFRTRQAGESKLDAKVALDFLGLVVNKLTGGLVPFTFIAFGLVGAAGVVVHLIVLRVLMNIGMAFGEAQIVATVIAIAFNFLLNNASTYRDRALRGLKWLRGLAMFYLVCSIGAVANVAVARLLFDHAMPWWFAAFGGIVMGAVWNYALSSLFVWRRRP